MRLADINYQTVMLPVLEEAAARDAISRRELTQAIGTRLQISPEEQRQFRPSGRGIVLRSRIGRAVTYLSKGGR